MIEKDYFISPGADLPAVELDINHPEDPKENVFIDAFNGSFRQEFLDENGFLAQRWYHVPSMHLDLKASHR